ncbi:TNT domain-containing protein [Umezawaea beigongshangensis]|uniref:TNT domain-containing protein n=1 Tax=Umezawaea beigongshangensis TaxID=2780383 RepID=UPI0018F17984|nr:TNT domain-containing protein [Umezawaea beigongshangensis]
MRTSRRFLLVLVTALVTLFGVSAPTAVAVELCSGAHDGDPRLGPEDLPGPAQRPVGPLLVTYLRTGGLSAEDFLDRYWDPAANSGAGSWIYPPQDGFRLDASGHPVKQVEELEAGDELDRFGGEGGTFLAPSGDLYPERALPPQNLTTFDPAYPCNYHLYRVTRSFDVWEGPIAAWFAQPGGGTQIKLDRSLLPGDGYLNVAWLIDNGYLDRID